MTSQPAKELGKLGGKARWEGKSKKEKKRLMSEARRKGYENKMLKLTEKQILSIAKNKGEFSLNWNYRVDDTRNLCRLMVKRGLLKLVRSNCGVDIWKLN